MTTDGDTTETMEEIRQEIGKALADQTARLSEVIRRQDSSSSSFERMSNQMEAMSMILKDLQTAIWLGRGPDDTGQRVGSTKKMNILDFIKLMMILESR